MNFHFILVKCQPSILNDKNMESETGLLRAPLLLDLFIDAQNENRRHHLGDEEFWNRV